MTAHSGDYQRPAGTLLFGYRHVTGVPLCPCRDPGTYMLCEQGDTPLSFVLRCWCGSSLRGTWDSDQERGDFLAAHGCDGDTSPVLSRTGVRP